MPHNPLHGQPTTPPVDESDAQSILGQPLRQGDRDVIISVVTGGENEGKLFLADRNTGVIIQMPFRGGVFTTGLGRQIEIDTRGNIVDTTGLPSAPSGGTSRRSIAEEIQLLGVQNEQAKELLELDFQYALQLEEARSANDLERAKDKLEVRLQEEVRPLQRAIA